MNEKSSLALIVSYYLSKFDKQALESLGYSTYRAAFDDIGLRLGVKPATIKNNRDIFDPIHSNHRVGWYQRKLRPGPTRIIESFGQLGERSLRSIVQGILDKYHQKDSSEVRAIMEFVRPKKNERMQGPRDFVPRGPTGKKAEEFFIDFHEKHGQPIPGKLADMRDYGCGYDFEIRGEDETAYVEVKGLDNVSGGITFTEKEWDTAASKQSHYYLVLVSGLNDEHETKIDIRLNPAETLRPTRRVYTSIQVNYSVPTNRL